MSFVFCFLMTLSLCPSKRNAPLSLEISVVKTETPVCHVWGLNKVFPFHFYDTLLYQYVCKTTSRELKMPLQNCNTNGNGHKAAVIVINTVAFFFSCGTFPWSTILSTDSRGREEVWRRQAFVNDHYHSLSKISATDGGAVHVGR